MDPEPLSRSALLWMTVARFLAGVMLLGCLVFLPAGTLEFWQAWLYMGLLFMPAAIITSALRVDDDSGLTEPGSVGWDLGSGELCGGGSQRAAWAWWRISSTTAW